MRRGPHNLNFSRRTLRYRRGISIVLLLTGFLVSLAAILPEFRQQLSLKDSPAETSIVRQIPPQDGFRLLQEFSPPRRRIFPYSVVPGGVSNLEEVKGAVSSDPVVAKHYSFLKLDELRPIRLQKARAAYVSYRVGGKIFWTKRKLRLAEGEFLLTDGTHTLRTRCGNLISEWPRPPISPEEPIPATFDTPLITPDPPPPLAPPLVLVPGPGDSVFFLPAVPIFPGGGPGPSPRKHFPGPPPPTVSVPEPATYVLLLSGLVFLLAMSKARNP